MVDSHHALPLKVDFFKCLGARLSRYDDTRNLLNGEVGRSTAPILDTTHQKMAQVL